MIGDKKNSIFRRLKKEMFSIGMMSPALLIIGLVVFFPTIYSFIMSLFDWRLGKERQFIGIQNYISIFTIREFSHSVLITVLFCLLVTIITIIFALFIAVLLNMELKGTKYLIAALMIPWAMPAIVTSVMFKYLFSPTWGTINNVLLTLGLIDKGIIFSILKWPAFFIIVLSSVYKMVPFSAFLFTATLKTIPKELYEAASIDGMSPIGRFFGITLPLIRPTVVIVSMLLSISTFKAFEMIYMLTMGGPGNFTAVLNFLAYKQTFQYMKFGSGAAIAFFVSILVLIVAAIYYKTTYREVKYD